MGSRGQIGRREFLRRGAWTGALIGGLPVVASAGSEPARVRRYVKLGRTALEISDIGFGSSRLSSDEDVVRHALELGINYFDTAESYRGGASETTQARQRPARAAPVGGPPRGLPRCSLRGAARPA